MVAVLVLATGFPESEVVFSPAEDLCEMLLIDVVGGISEAAGPCCAPVKFMSGLKNVNSLSANTCLLPVSIMCKFMHASLRASLDIALHSFLVLVSAESLSKSVGFVLARLFVFGLTE